MKRLTIRNADGSVSQPTDLNWAEVLEKLADYEDTGLEPEEIKDGTWMEWINCKDQLPELNAEGDWSDDVLVVMQRYDYPREKKAPYYEIMVGYYAPGEGWYTFMHNNCAQVGVEKLPPYPRNGHIHRTTDEIVYWMPLPELPKED